MSCQRGIETSFVPCLWYYPKLDNLKGMRNSNMVFVKGRGQSLRALQSTIDRHLNIQWKGCHHHPLPTLSFKFCTVCLPSLFLSPVIIALPVFCLPYGWPWTWEETPCDIWIWVRIHPKHSLCTIWITLGFCRVLTTHCIEPILKHSVSLNKF